MKTFLFLLISLSALAKDKDVVVNVDSEWLCTVSAFSKKYEALASSKTKAKFNAMEKCKEDNNEMHCHFEKCVSED